ncbi:MAG: hypothetical protein RIQ60_2140 [Pseudomonadota bacterium]|jgi:glycosyltransferase involved in cell wall biosynthesis
MSPHPLANERYEPNPLTGRVRSRKWLVLSHAFNMDGRAASLTVTDKLPFLETLGIEPVIISGAMGHADTRYAHFRRLPWGPAGLRFDLRHVIADRLGRGLAYRWMVVALTVLLAPLIALERLLLGLRHQWSWALPAWWKARRLLAQGDIELVYSSGGAYSAHLAGLWLKRSTGCRWIAEIHDPIVIPGALPRTRDARFQAWLEGAICREADLVWWFTDGALEAARQRHPTLGERGIMVLPGANPPVRRVDHVPNAKCTFGHFGSLSATRSLAPALRGLAELLQQRPQIGASLVVEIYGGGLDPEAAALVEPLGLGAVVKVVGRLEHDAQTGLSGRERVMVRMQQMDWLLMMHGVVPECAEYIPSKLYDYFWARRPVLGFTWRNPQLDALITEHGGRAISTDDAAAVLKALEAAYDDWAAGRMPVADAPPLSVQGAVSRIVQAASLSPGDALTSGVGQ